MSTRERERERERERDDYLKQPPILFFYIKYTYDIQETIYQKNISHSKYYIFIYKYFFFACRNKAKNDFSDENSTNTQARVRENHQCCRVVPCLLILHKDI